MSNSIGKEGLKQLTRLMNKIVIDMKIPKKSNKGTILPIYKKGDTGTTSSITGKY